MSDHDASLKDVARSLVLQSRAGAPPTLHESWVFRFFDEYTSIDAITEEAGFFTSSEHKKDSERVFSDLENLLNTDSSRRKIHFVDLGCGPSPLIVDTAAFSTKYVRYTAVDASSSMLRMASNKVHQKRNNWDFCAINSDLQNIPSIDVRDDETVIVLILGYLYGNYRGDFWRKHLDRIFLQSTPLLTVVCTDTLQSGKHFKNICGRYKHKVDLHISPLLRMGFSREALKVSYDWNELETAVIGSAFVVERSLSPSSFILPELREIAGKAIRIFFARKPTFDTLNLELESYLGKSKSRYLFNDTAWMINGELI